MKFQKRKKNQNRNRKNKKRKQRQRNDPSQSPSVFRRKKWNMSAKIPPRVFMAALVM